MHKNLPKLFYFISEFEKNEINNLNRNIAIIYRNYLTNHDEKKISEIKKFCKSTNRKFFLSNNIKLALKLNLDGAYIPSFNKELKINLFSKKKNFIILGSAHNLNEIRIKEKQGVKAIFLSQIYKVKKSTKELGIYKFINLTKLSNKKIIALGGINKYNLKRTMKLAIHGFAGISYFKKV